MEQGALCQTREIPAAEWPSSGLLPPDGSLVLEHEPISFPNYPYEWTPEMLAAAGRLTLEMAETAALSGFGLKDATPYNIMFDGARPVFLDLLSFEDRDPTDILWRPYAQFMRTFVYPLLVNRNFGLELGEILMTHRDGLEPEQVRRLCPWWRLALPPLLGAVTLPSLFSEAGSPPSQRDYRPRRARTAQEALFVLSRLFRRAGKLLASGERGSRSGRWSHYAETGHKYSTAEMGAKEAAIKEAISKYRPKRVLDVGCNTGRFSLLAAEAGASVVAIDRDAGVAGALWREASRSVKPILPLVIDIARPPGAVGWANSECLSFLDRAAARFDCVLMLALVHHLIVNERVPLPLIFSLVAKLTTDLLVIEYVDPSDAQFQAIARGRDVLHRDLNEASFEQAAKELFEIAASAPVTASRRIYVLRKKP
jgi:SAM-dependent methyltransferase